ncbi:MAG: hypothetical protein U0X92_08730 [Anaerolineales bacterium]
MGEHNETLLYRWNFAVGITENWMDDDEQQRIIRTISSRRPQPNSAPPNRSRTFGFRAF